MTLKEKYEKEITPKIMSEFGIKNVMATPKLTKITINMGIGDALKNKAVKKALLEDMAAITGQKASERKAKISVASFSIRRGMVVGLKTTLRGIRMYDFFEKFVNIVLPRLRDFRGAKIGSFDKFGNYTIGISEHSVFPEIDTTKSANPHGLEITITTSAENPKRGRKLLELLGMPFEKEGEGK
ncbi:50S ribosomal protein L5 [Candidatus Microgenomates bacterium]|nr:50S ribosomal protein L5 [Candidatus Microgenomates bacterium]